jgi:hypothetical protein
VKRVLTAYGHDDYFVSDEEFPEEKVEILKTYFDLYEDDPEMLYSYPVPENLRDRVGEILGIRLDPQLNYNLEVTE